VFGVPGARALLAAHVREGVAYYVTRSDPAALVAIDHLGGHRRSLSSEEEEGEEGAPGGALEEEFGEDGAAGSAVGAGGVSAMAAAAAAAVAVEAEPRLGVCTTFVNGSHMGAPLRRAHRTLAATAAEPTPGGEVLFTNATDAIAPNTSFSALTSSPLASTAASFSASSIPSWSLLDDDVLLSVPLTLPDPEEFTAQLERHHQHVQQSRAGCRFCPGHVLTPRSPLRLSSSPGAVSVMISLQLNPGARLKLADITASLEFRPAPRLGPSSYSSPLVSVQLLRWGCAPRNC